MSDLNDGLAKLIDSLNHVSGPAVDSALASAQVDALSAIAGGCVGLAVAAASYKAIRWCIRRLKALDHHEEELPFIIGAVISGLCLLGGALAVGIDLLDPWTYVALAHPDYWVAHQILHGGVR